MRENSEMRAWVRLIEELEAPRFDDIRKLMRWADKQGVLLTVERLNDGFWLSEFQRDHSADRGSGARVLRATCALADRAGLPISLEVVGHNDQLERYYARFGFSVDEHSRTEEGDVIMTRPANVTPG